MALMKAADMSMLTSSKLFEEGPQGLGGLPFADPDDPAGVVVDDDRDVLVPLAVADLIHSDAAQVLEAVHVQFLVDETGGDPPHGDPGDPDELGHGGVVELLGQQAHGILERTGEDGPGSCPRNALGAHGLAVWATQPTHSPPQEHPEPAEAQVAPLALGLLEASPYARSALRAGEQTEPPLDVDEQSVAHELDPSHPESWKVEQLVQ
jgi:hypothetical protein